MRRRRETTTPTPQETLNDVREQWQAGKNPDFHVSANDTIEEGARVVVIDGDHAGGFGRVVLTYDSPRHRMVAWMLALTPGYVRVMLDDGWSGVMPVTSLKPTRVETDTELYARINERYGHWGAFLSLALESSGGALDDCARQINLERRELPIFGADEEARGFPKR